VFVVPNDEANVIDDIGQYRLEPSIVGGTAIYQPLIGFVCAHAGPVIQTVRQLHANIMELAL
jgi:hypothetical protein